VPDPMATRRAACPPNETAQPSPTGRSHGALFSSTVSAGSASAASGPGGDGPERSLHDATGGAASRSCCLGTRRFRVKVRLDYGDEGLLVDLPDSTVVVAPERRPPLAEPMDHLIAALRQPTIGPALRDFASPGARVVISVCDGTRPQPRELMVKSILEELSAVQAADQVTVLIATGTHRGNTSEELRRMLGEEILYQCRVVNHDCRDSANLVAFGTVAGDVPVALNRHWVDADVRITTGFVEPHFFAGFSGGPKMVAPGLASLETVMALHNGPRIGHPRATWGIVEGNPVHDAIRETARVCPPHFSVDVLLNVDKQITHVFSGELWEMHRRARETAQDVAMRALPRRFPVVVTTNSGFPLDQNLYQAVKGMSAAAEIVEDGGIIICAAECREGLPDGGVYGELLHSGDDIQEIDRRIGASDEVIPDQWQLQVQARVQRRARVLVKAEGLTNRQVAAAHLEPVDDIGSFIREEMEKRGELAVAALPSGPQTIAYVR
jgi:lactate racemase